MNERIIKFEANFRSTGMGGYNNTRLFSFRQKKELTPHRSERSRTGNHGTDIWFLLPGNYLRWSASFSNSGKGIQGFDMLITNGGVRFEEFADSTFQELRKNNPWILDLPDDKHIEPWY